MRAAVASAPTSAVARVASRGDALSRRMRAVSSPRTTTRGGRRATKTTVAMAVPFSPAGAQIAGVGMAVPKQSLTNDDLASLVDTNDEWIKTRTGIGKRHVISGDESLTSLAAEAATDALKMAGVDAKDVDLIILATSSPDDVFGSACTVQAAIGAEGALAFDLTAACSGFVVGLVNGVHFIRGGEYKNVLVIGADVLSRYVDWRDRGTCILFGDGCGAMVLTSTPNPEDCCVLGFDMHSDGTGNHNLTAKFTNENGAEVNDGASKPRADTAAANSGRGAFCNIGMNGQEVFKFAVRAVPDTVGKSLAHAGLENEDVDHLVLHQARSPHTGSHTTALAWWTPILKDFCRRVSAPRVPRFQYPSSTPFNSASDAFQLHPDIRRFLWNDPQANQRIIDGAAKKLGLSSDKVVSNIAKYGNTSAGSVPIALAEAVTEGKVRSILWSTYDRVRVVNADP
jgi:3-oxoacyl-[acyl-carrier-protein] synthase-3